MFPVEPNVIVPFLVAVTLVELTPGPNMGYLAALSAAEGRAVGFKAVLGVTLGLAAYMLGAVAGVTELLIAAPLAYGALRWAGVAYLLYLAWEAWRGAGEPSPGPAVARDSAPFWRGLIANLLNPKAAIFYVTLLPTFIQPDHAAFWVQALILGCAHLMISVVIHGAIVIGVARAGALLVSPTQAMTIRRALALGIALTAFWLAWGSA